MKIAFNSGIHCNLPAFQAVNKNIEHWKPDMLVGAGDIINRGPDPQGCLRFIVDQCQTSGWQVIFGNHEKFVFGLGRQLPLLGTQYAFHQPAIWTYDQIFDSRYVYYER